MHGRRLWGFLLSLCLGCTVPCADAFERLAEPYFSTVAGTEVLPYGVVTALRQDHSGLLWIGTQQGLWSYDGYRMKPLQAQGEAATRLRAAYVYTLAETAPDRLWIGTQSDGLFRYSRDSGIVEQYRDADAAGADAAGDEAVFALIADADGGLYVGSNAGLDYRAPGGDAVQRIAVSNTPLPVRALLLDRSGALWVGTLHGLFRRAAGQREFEPQFAADGLTQPITSLFEAADGSLWVGTQTDGAVRIDRERRQLQRLQGDAAVALEQAWVRAFIEAQPGELWVATWGAGVAVIDTGTAGLRRRIEQDRAMIGSLGIDYIGSFWLDRAGLLWLGTWGAGLQRHNPTAQAFRSLRHRPFKAGSLGQADVYSLFEDTDGLLWVGLDGRGIDLVDRERGVIEHFAPRPGNAQALGDGTISGITRSADGSLWIGTQQAGLHRFDPTTRRFERYDRRHGLVDNSVRRLLASRSGALWVGTEAGLDRFDPVARRFERVLGADGAPLPQAFWCLTEDARGRLWAGTPAGLYLVEPEAPLRLVAATAAEGAGLSHQQVRGLLVDAEDRLWVDTAGGLDQLVEWDGQRARFAAVGARIGRPGFALGGNLQQDRAGRIWSARYRFDPATGQVDEFGRADGVDIGNNWVGAFARTHDGLLLFGGTEGILVIDPERDPLPARNFEPVLLATELKIDGQSVPLPAAAAPLRLGPQQRRISLEFAALDFAAPELLRYAYRLDGVDADWIETDAGNRVASYNNLWPGQYQLRVRGSNRAGRFAEQELQLRFEVLPAFWQTPWFVLLVLCAVVVGVYAGVHWRTGRIRRRARALQSMVEQRTAELRGALDELRRTQHDLVEQEKMASLGGLVAGVAHEINTPIGVALTASSHLEESLRALFAKFDAHKLKPEDLAQFRRAATESTRLALDSLVRARDLVASFKRVAVDRSREKPRRFQLAELLAELEIGWRADPRYARLEIQVECAEKLEVHGYPGALGQVLNELLDNALQHAFPAPRQGHVRISATSDGRSVRLCFADDGVGMGAETIGQAFEPFFTTRRGAGCAGLGLHVIYNLVTRLFGGTIELRADAGRGSEFELRFPQQLSLPSAPLAVGVNGP